MQTGILYKALRYCNCYTAPLRFHVYSLAVLVVASVPPYFKVRLQILILDILGNRHHYLVPSNIFYLVPAG
jgi:hypothetical protein